MNILEIKILCNDLLLAEEFYTQRLGLLLTGKSTRTITVRAGLSQITFVATKGKQPIYHFAFNIPHNQLEESLTWITPKATLISNYGEVIVDFSNWNARSVYFYDSLGNILEFIARRDLDNATHQPFSPESLQCVSEIAVATNNVFEFTERMKLKYGLALYKKQPLLENFAAMGDADGLMIVSRAGRKWFPTEQISRLAYVAVRIEHNRRDLNLVFNRSLK